MDPLRARLQRCIDLPVPRHFLPVQRRLRIYYIHLQGLDEIIAHTTTVVPQLVPYLTRIALIYGQLLESQTIIVDLDKARTYNQKAINKAFGLLEDFEQFGIPTVDLLNVIESIQLLLDHHDSLVNTFGFFVFKV